MQHLKGEWTLTSSAEDFESQVVNVYPEIEKQKILGFGGAFTEAAGYNYAQLTEEQREQFMEACFGETGCRYRIGRVPMGSCDFSLTPYMEADKPDLSDFNIEHDKTYIIQMVRDALKKAGDLFLFASPWSPPAFMKDNGTLNYAGKLLPEFYQTYAQYFVKFIEAYRAEGIRFSAVTVQNEARAKQTWESCLFTAEEEAIFATRHLRPALDAAGLSDVKILIWDHNRERILDRARDSFAIPGAKEAIWGMGYHWYSGEHFDAMDEFCRLYPDKVLLETEFCNGGIASFDEEHRNVAYAREYIRSLKHGAAGLCDWNLMLDAEGGGPYHWRRGGCAAVFYHDARCDALVEDGIYRAVKTVISDIAVGDRVVATTAAWGDLAHVAVKHADGTVTLILLNAGDQDRDLHVRMGKSGGTFTLPAHTVASVKVTEAFAGNGKDAV